MRNDFLLIDADIILPDLIERMLEVVLNVIKAYENEAV
jgi:hypothetical protein